MSSAELPFVVISTIAVLSIDHSALYLLALLLSVPFPIRVLKSKVIFHQFCCFTSQFFVTSSKSFVLLYL